MPDYIYPEESKRILGIAMQLHRELGCGFKEKVYQDAFEVLLQENDIPYEREKHIKLTYHGVTLEHDFFYDFLIDDKIGVELKAVSEIYGEFEAQIINYLHVSNHKLGLLLNFGTTSLDYKWYPNEWHHRTSASIGG
jgi:GxxExxY protein